jgi:hypothetical protein
MSTTVIQFAGFQEMIVGLSMFQLKHATGEHSMFFGLENYAWTTGGMLYLRFGVRKGKNVPAFRFMFPPPSLAVILTILCWVFVGHQRAP